MFRFFVTSDSNIEAGVGEATQDFITNKFNKFIENQDYGETLKGIAIFFMCRDPNLKFKQRIRYHKNRQELFMDIMLDYNEFVAMTHEQRILKLCKKLLTEIPPIVKKYKFKDFDLDKLMCNLEHWFTENDLI